MPQISLILNLVRHLLLALIERTESGAAISCVEYGKACTFDHAFHYPIACRKLVSHQDGHDVAAPGIDMVFVSFDQALQYFRVSVDVEGQDMVF